MPKLPIHQLTTCHLTTRDFHLLRTLSERSVYRDEAFLRLLRQKLSTATVVFPEDIDPQVATINSRVDFSVDGQPSESRALVHDGDHAVAGLTIATLRGLALLGMREGETVVVERSDGKREELRLDRVAYQPEAARRAGSGGLDAAERDAGAEPQASVILFPGHRKPASRHIPSALIGAEDDDPGPGAA
jgi:regulator of nucleoside diphosphate kinase